MIRYLLYSLGCTAVFLIGGTEKSVKPTAINLKSGDIAVMSKESRLSYHAVPCILQGTYRPTREEDEEADESDKKHPSLASVSNEEWKNFERFLRCSRININTRQVNPCETSWSIRRLGVFCCELNLWFVILVNMFNKFAVLYKILHACVDIFVANRKGFKTTSINSILIQTRNKSSNFEMSLNVSASEIFTLCNGVSKNLSASAMQWLWLSNGNDAPATKCSYVKTSVTYWRHVIMWCVDTDSLMVPVCSFLRLWNSKILVDSYGNNHA